MNGLVGKPRTSCYQMSDAIIETYTMNPTSLAQMQEHWHDKGWLWEHGVLTASDCRELARCVHDIEEWEDSADAWLKYHEPSVDGTCPRLSRVENFLDSHQGLRQLLSEQLPLSERLTALASRPCVLFKDKLNIKPARGAGYAPHQDAPAYTGFGPRDFITVMIPIDDSCMENGCLELADEPKITIPLIHGPDGRLADPRAERLVYLSIPAHRGDVVYFDGWIPHRSGPNRSCCARRALFLTYNALAEGDHRAEYFHAKRAAFPPCNERKAGVEYRRTGHQFNLGNPFL